MPYKKRATIQISKRTWKYLAKGKDYNESWDDYLRDLLKYYRENARNPDQLIKILPPTHNN